MDCFGILTLFNLSLLFFTAVFAAIIYAVHKLGLYYTLFTKIDTDESKHGGQLVAEVLAAHGVKFIFTLCGGHISPILVASEKKGIRIVDVRHEVTSVFAADAVARLSGTVGVAAVTAGPGLTNTVTAIKNAQMAESPILLLGGAAASILKGRGALQDIDQMCLFKPLCKYTATVSHIRDTIPTLRKALQIAQSGTPGPVFVEFPIDSLYPYHMVKREVGATGSPKGLVGGIVQWYLNNYLNNLFAGAWDHRDPSPLPVVRPIATQDEVQKCTELLSRSKKPLILLGSQSTLPPVPAEKIRQALEKIGVPCFLGGMSRGLLGRKSSLQIRQRRKDALAEADLVILAGTVCDFRLSYGRVLKRKSKIIAVNRNYKQLYKNSDMFWKPDVAVQADVGSFLVSLSESIGALKYDSDWLSLLRSRDDEKEESNKKRGEEPTNVHLNPIAVLHHAEETMSDNTILVADGGDFVGTASYILRPRGPLKWLDPGAFGTLGVGGGFALGAKLVRPDSDVWIIYGDGSLGYSVAEFDTFQRHKLPVIALVGTDASWSQIAREQVPMFGTSVGCDLEFSDYHTVANGYGAKGVLLDRSNYQNISEIFKEAISDSRKGKSVLINCLIGKTNFRDGSISV